MSGERTYLGDGVFVEATAAGDVVLSTRNGIEALEARDMIVLEARVLEALMRFLLENRP